MTGDDDIRLAQFETLVEATAPPPENPCRCTCNRCVYGPRYIGREVHAESGRSAA